MAGIEIKLSEMLGRKVDRKLSHIAVDRRDALIRLPVAEGPSTDPRRSRSQEALVTATP
jgi:hypothetical protein